MLDEVLAAIADPTRRAMIQRLAHGPASTGQLAALFPISRPAVSQHLRLLRLNLRALKANLRLAAYLRTSRPPAAEP